MFDLLLAERRAVALVPELARDVDVRRADPGVDARPRAARQRLAARLDIHGTARESAQIEGPRISRAIRCTASESSGDDAG